MAFPPQPRNLHLLQKQYLFQDFKFPGLFLTRFGTTNYMEEFEHALNDETIEENELQQQNDGYLLKKKRVTTYRKLEWDVSTLAAHNK
jgi:hypothetical protein